MFWFFKIMEFVFFFGDFRVGIFCDNIVSKFFSVLIFLVLYVVNREFFKWYFFFFESM